ncbi:MAG: hypothetical protein AMJ67_13960 [Betaproteobacteria bacterium SG8_41]|jgi:hypothetical protein|nr:MAG: hypothetical protein AMJ67_13960 [Betaproteobacteria bacterium SG8_41]
MYHHYSEIPTSVRVLYTAALLVLGMGYLFALIYIFTTYAPKDGNPRSLSYEDIVIGYSGSGEDSRIESALRGPMRSMLPSEEINVVISWVRAGADRPAYENQIRPIVDKRCLACHDGSNPHLANLNGYDNLHKVTEKDTGPAVTTLVRVSHIHLFGLSFIFFILGSIFSHAYVRPVWLKCLVVATPFACIVLDVISWYLVKLFHPFAWVVMLGGAAYGACFAFMWVVSMYQMWVGRTPSKVAERAGSVG